MFYLVITAFALSIQLSKISAFSNATISLVDSSDTFIKLLNASNSSDFSPDNFGYDIL